MTTVIAPQRFSGLVRVPASKSHTIRRLLIASLADGVSEIEHPLDSLDTRSCLSVCRALGAEIAEHRGFDSISPNIENPLRWIVRGNTHNDPSAGKPKCCDVGNSGTTLFLGLAAASLGKDPVEFDGDDQVRLRSAAPLLEALTGLGVNVTSGPGGCVPITVRGPWKGGKVDLPCPTSQYLSALLLAAPLAPDGVATEIDVPLLNERPYIEMTLSYLDSQGISYGAKPDFTYFSIPGGSAWKPLTGSVPGDFSSAAFPAAAAVISGGSVTLLGLDPNDTQGDKAFFGFLEKMGCSVQWEKQPICPQPNGLQSDKWRLTVSRQGPLVGGTFDLNDTPDLLPALAAIACFACGDTALVNVASARMKETDRIAVMAEELGKLGVKATQRSDALVIHGGEKLSSAKLNGRFDHRVVMALASAALGCPSPVEIAGAESAAVSYPGFLEMFGANSL